MRLFNITAGNSQATSRIERSLSELLLIFTIAKTNGQVATTRALVDLPTVYFNLRHLGLNHPIWMRLSGLDLLAIHQAYNGRVKVTGLDTDTSYTVTLRIPIGCNAALRIADKTALEFSYTGASGVAVTVDAVGHRRTTDNFLSIVREEFQSNTLRTLDLAPNGVASSAVLLPVNGQEGLLQTVGGQSFTLDTTDLVAQGLAKTSPMHNYDTGKMVDGAYSTFRADETGKGDALRSVQFLPVSGSSSAMLRTFVKRQNA